MCFNSHGCYFGFYLVFYLVKTCFACVYLEKASIECYQKCSTVKEKGKDQILPSVVACSFTVKMLLEQRGTLLPALVLMTDPFVTPAIRFSMSQKSRRQFLSSVDLIQIFSNFNRKRIRPQILYSHQNKHIVLVVQCTEMVGVVHYQSLFFLV